MSQKSEASPLDKDTGGSRPGEMPLGSLPHGLIDGAMRDVIDFTIGFVKAPGQPGEEPQLLGSGTLVSVNGKRAILTAEHVLRFIRENVPAGSRLGLLIQPNLPRTTVAMHAIDCLPIARGKVDSEGPDLGAILLASEAAGALAAKKRFYNMDSVRKQLLEKPPDRHAGFWFVSGFPATEAVRTRDEDGEVVRFMNMHGAGGPEEPEMRDGFDYYKFPVVSREAAPQSFGGMSGGGFWQIRIRRRADGQLETLPALLSGVAFYQIATAEEYALICHGRESIYRMAYRAIQSGQT